MHVDGHPLATAMVRDVTEARRSARELHFATEFNQRIIDTLDALVIVMDREPQGPRVQQRL